MPDNNLRSDEEAMTPQEAAYFAAFAEECLEKTTEPEDLLWPTLDPAALYGIAGELTKAIEPHTESDIAALLVQTLTAFGSMVGRSAYFQVESDRHYPNLFAVLCGPTSKARKGTSWKHVEALARQIDEGWVKACIRSGASSGEGITWALRDPIVKQEPVREKSRVVGYESVVIDEGVADKRLLVIEAEFASVLRVMGRHGNTLSAVLRSAWDGATLAALTKNSAATATDAHVSFIGHVTEDELRRYLDSTEMCNGYANRFLWVLVRRSKLLPEGGKLDSVGLSAVVLKLRQAVDFARKAGRIQFDDQARRVWHDVYPELSEGHSGLYGAATSRGEAQVVRLALVYALLDQSNVIRQEHLTAALALWEYCEASAAHIFGDTIGNPIADAILGALRRNPQGMTRTEIMGLFNRNRTGEEINMALVLLSRARMARSQTIQTAGRPCEMWWALTKKTN